MAAGRTAAAFESAVVSANTHARACNKNSERIFSVGRRCKASKWRQATCQFRQLAAAELQSKYFSPENSRDSFRGVFKRRFISAPTFLRCRTS